MLAAIIAHRIWSGHKILPELQISCEENLKIYEKYKSHDVDGGKALFHK